MYTAFINGLALSKGSVQPSKHKILGGHPAPWIEQPPVLPKTCFLHFHFLSSTKKSTIGRVTPYADWGFALGQTLHLD
jgi:hypothetical protein